MRGADDEFASLLFRRSDQTNRSDRQQSKQYKSTTSPSPTPLRREVRQVQKHVPVCTVWCSVHRCIISQRRCTVLVASLRRSIIRRYERLRASQINGALKPNEEEFKNQTGS